MSAIILQDEFLHYEALGRGRPLVFLHSWVGSWRYWIPSMQAASTGFRAYALDLWGFGDSGKLSSGYSLEGQTALLDQFLAEMGIGKIALIGHGLGAILAMGFAARCPERVDRLMAVSFPESEARIQARLRTGSPIELADWLLGRDPAGEAARGEASKADPLAIEVSLADLQEIDLAALSLSLAVPSLLVYGQNDPAIAGPSPEGLLEMPEHIHGVIFEASGHFPMLDEPAKFNRLMTDFLALGSGVSPRQLQLKEEWKRRVR